MLEDRSTAVQATSRLLSELLTSHRQYRHAWQQHVRRERTGDLSRAGIAQVIAHYLWDSGERADTDIELARRLRDRVRRAVDGENLTAETLTWFIRAFDMNKTHEHQLWATFAGGSPHCPEAISGTLLTRRLRRCSMQHRTVTMFERYVIDADRRLTDRHVLRVIAALEDNVDRYLYTQEPTTARVDVLAGGQLGETYDDEGRILREIRLNNSLRQGFTASLEYRNHYIDNYSPIETRRAFPGNYENVDIAIHFDPQQTPKTIRFAVWADHYAGEPVFCESILLDSASSVHRFIPRVEQSVLGFQWKW